MSTPLTVIAILTAILIGRLTAAPRLYRRATELERLRDQLAQAAFDRQHDPLTGQLSRHGLTIVHAQWQQNRQYLVAVFVDLDDFKTINDTYGHAAGDRVLGTVGERLGEVAKIYGGAVARLSGDEFVVLLPLRDADMAWRIDAILDHITRPIVLVIAGLIVRLDVAASAGAAWGSPTDHLHTLLDQADIAMYAAKTDSGRRHVFYEAGMAKPASNRRGLRARDRREVQDPS